MRCLFHYNVFFPSSFVIARDWMLAKCFDVILHFLFKCLINIFIVSGQYEDLVTRVTNFHNEEKGFMILDGDVFDVPIRKDIVHRVVRWQLAKRQQVPADVNILFCHKCILYSNIFVFMLDVKAYFLSIQYV